jgi:hypothetical protein
MKTFILVIAVLGAVFLWQRQNEHAATPTSANVKQTNAASAPVAQPSPRPVSEHDWAKHSLDRAHEVADQVRTARQENQP